jgi:hypothetical protein
MALGAGQADSPPAGPVTRSWRVWRGSPELLAHVARVAERASGGTDTKITVAVADDEEIFPSSSDFVRDVTLDALRHFSSIAIVSKGPSMSVSITLRWTGERPELSGDWNLYLGWLSWITWSGQDAEVIVSADGVDSASEREALEAVHNAIKRGGTDRFGQRRAFLISIQVVAIVVLIATALAVVYLATGRNLLADGIGPAFSISEMQEQMVTVGAVTLILLSLATICGVTVGRWAYPSLEVAERGETRLWRVARWSGGIAVTVAIAVVIKLVARD